jgi:hypothetical protein
MPDRIIRDELLDSEKYLDLPSDSHRLLFIHLILLADDLGNTEAGTGFLRRRAMCGSTPAAIAALISHLVDVDLIRLYSVGDKQYVHIPKFRQRLRYMTRLRHPRPPEHVECNEIKDLILKKSDYSLTTVRPESDYSQTVVGKYEEKRREEKRREEEPPRPPADKSPGGSVVGVAGKEPGLASASPGRCAGTTLPEGESQESPPSGTLPIKDAPASHQKGPRSDRRGGVATPGAPGAANRSEAVLLPDWISPETWGEFLRFRKGAKSPMTDFAQKKAIGVLGKLRDRGFNPDAVIEQSIINGWKGFFPIRENNDKRGKRYEEDEKYDA